MTFFSTLTATGQIREAIAHTASQPLVFTHMAVGSGDVGDQATARNRAALVNEVWRGSLERVSIDKNNPSQIIAECVVPAEIGGFWIRELLLFDSSGAGVVIAKVPDSYKPTSVEGAIRTQRLRVVIRMSYANVVTLMLDPNIVTYQDIVDEVASHEAKTDPHPQYRQGRARRFFYANL